MNAEGKGVISILDAKSVASDPTIYSTFLLYLLSELYENLPEVGDLMTPRMVFFFDEAHLLFQDCEKALLEKITQVTRLIRSKGIGIYYVSQNPASGKCPFPAGQQNPAWTFRLYPRREKEAESGCGQFSGESFV